MFLTSVFIRCLYVVVRCVCVSNTNNDGEGGGGSDDDCFDDGSNNGHGRINQANDSWHTHIHFSQCDVFGYRWVSHAIKFTLILCVSFIRFLLVFMFGSFSIYFDFRILSYERATLFLHISFICFHIRIHGRQQTNQTNKLKHICFMQRLRTQTHLDFSFDNVFALICSFLCFPIRFRMTYTRICHTD